MPKRSLLLLLAAMLACPMPALADTVTIGYFDPAANMSGIQIIGQTSGPITTTTPTVQLLGGPPFTPNPSILGAGFGFDHIIATGIPPTGKCYSAGLGEPNPTPECA